MGQNRKIISGHANVYKSNELLFSAPVENVEMISIREHLRFYHYTNRTLCIHKKIDNHEYVVIMNALLNSTVLYLIISFPLPGFTDITQQMIITGVSYDRKNKEATIECLLAGYYSL